MNKLDQTKERLFIAFAEANGIPTKVVIILNMAFKLALISEDWKWYNKIKRGVMNKVRIMAMSPIEQEQFFDSYMRRMRMK